MIFDEVSKRANKEFAKNAILGMELKKERKKEDQYSIMDLMMKPTS